MTPPERAVQDSPLLRGLNPAQREAVVHGDGPLLVLAGAGSGKTRVITHRLAWLILERGVLPREIVALTFTNKAAGEMRERVEALLGERLVGAWVGTFHALCLRILRREGERIGLRPGFTVYDTDDQLSLVRRLLRDAQSDDAPAQARPVLSWISRQKNALERPEGAEKRQLGEEGRFRARIWLQYEEALRRANAADFDDLLVRTLELFEDGELARKYGTWCRHLLVDEYQDTNRPQYLLARVLSGVHGNICVVGDEDQSIYRFRGAELRNILEFERDHPGATTIKLEENYRSTGTILEAAGAVVARNTARKGKVLWTRNPRGERIELCRAPDDRGEAVWVSARVRELARELAYDRIAVLYRTNAQSRSFEEIFRRDRIPHQVIGAVRFYERREVKDLLAWLRLAADPDDDVSFRRAVAAPPRGIGDGTLEPVEALARQRAISLHAASRAAVAEGRVASRGAKLLAEFAEYVGTLAARAREGEGPSILLERLVRDLKYEAWLEKSDPGRGPDRMENVRALIAAAAEHEEEGATEDGPPTLQTFLDRSALVSDADDVGGGPGVTLMTIHVAKGLEWDAVFLPGLEENLFPHARAAASEEDLEEERRLCYVAMTRARRRLFLSHAGLRRLFGELSPNRPSRFLDEIPPALLQEVASAPGWSPWEAPARNERWSAGGGSAMRAPVRHVAPPPGPVAPSAAARPMAARADAAGAAEDGFRVGATVLHPAFGSGKVTGREGSGKGLKLTILFKDHGSKKILPAYTSLRIQT